MKPRILVVDDHPANLKLAAEVLRFDGFEVETAADAPAALALLTARLPDLLLTDIAMPGMDGLSLTRLLKADPATRNLPIVALTASAMKGDDARILAAGCDGYVPKPIDTRRLGGLMREFLARPPGEDEQRQPGRT